MLLPPVVLELLPPEGLQGRIARDRILDAELTVFSDFPCEMGVLSHLEAFLRFLDDDGDSSESVPEKTLEGVDLGEGGSRLRGLALSTCKQKAKSSDCCCCPTKLFIKRDMLDTDELLLLLCEEENFSVSASKRLIFFLLSSSSSF